MSVPDYQLEQTIYYGFSTRTAAGAPITFAGTPAIDIYEQANLTQITGSETLTVDFDSVTGAHQLQIDATAANGFESGKFYRAVVQAGTVNGQSVVGETILNFSIDASAAVKELANGVDGLAVIKADTAATLVDTNELQADWTNAGRLDAILDTIAADVVNIDGAAMRGTDSAATAAALATVDANVDAILVDTAEIGAAGAGLTDLGGMSTAMKAEVNAEVVDTLATDTYAEPAQGAPAATASLATKIGFLYKGWRNRSNQTATLYQLFNDDAVTVDHKATVSDDATTAEKGEVVTGP